MVNERKLPNGLDPLIDRANDKGIIFGIWLEPEMVNVKSELFEAHPEWVVQQPNREIVKGRGGSQMLLDLSNPEVQDFIYNTIHDLLVKHPQIGYIKWDANHFISNVGSTYLPYDKQSHLYIEYHRGLKKTMDRIRKDHPDIIMQACASGGGRMNYGYLPWFHEFWTSDVTDAVKRVSIQWGASYFFPAMVQGSHVSPSPNHQTGRLLPLKFRCDVAMTGRFGLEMQPKDLDEEDKARTRTTIETYKSIRTVIQLGDQYRLISPYNESALSATMYVTPEKDRAVFFAFALKDNLNPKFPPVKLNGLDPGKKYKLTEINNIDPDGRNIPGNNQEFTGKFLMDVGVQVNLRGVYTSRVIELTEVD
jgi:alpha-galactosidase